MTYTLFVFYSAFMCFRKIEEANRKCIDCSSEFLEQIICRACASQCHKGHRLTKSSNKMCRCLHMNPLKNSKKFHEETPFEEINATENDSLISHPSNTPRNKETAKESSKSCLLSLTKTKRKMF